MIERRSVVGVQWTELSGRDAVRAWLVANKVIRSSADKREVAWR
jgi:hypothetical protein